MPKQMIPVMTMATWTLYMVLGLFTGKTSVEAAAFIWMPWISYSFVYGQLRRAIDERDYWKKMADQK